MHGGGTGTEGSSGKWVPNEGQGREHRKRQLKSNGHCGVVWKPNRVEKYNIYVYIHIYY